MNNFIIYNLFVLTESKYLINPCQTSGVFDGEGDDGNRPDRPPRCPSCLYIL
jgi:hypothetical protein